MGRVTRNCPGCGASVMFLWSSAVQSSCPYCKAILVRHDVDLERVGEVADLPKDASPIQILTEGVFQGKTFQVIGRIVYSWEQGNWSEWHVLFSDERSGWLSDAQGEYAVTFAWPQPPALPKEDEVRRGQTVKLGEQTYMVTHLTKARYEGFQGELPFTTADKSEMLFADLRSPDARFATIDYSEEPPLLFAGQWVEFDELKLKNLREFEGW